MSSKRSIKGAEAGSNDRTTSSRRVRARRVARAGVAALLLSALAVTTLIYYAHRTTDKAYAIGDPIDPPLPEAGRARPWEVELPVSTYSSWHSRHGNCLTRIPIISISGTGPSLSVWLYHNAASVNESFDIMGGAGFDLGPGWTISYSSQLLLDDLLNPTTVTVVGDDGAQDVYAWDGIEWAPPAGVHDELTAEFHPDGSSTWQLKHKDQSYREYYQFSGQSHARLQRIVGAAVDETAVTYSVTNVLHIQEITGAGGRLLEFIYDDLDRLEKIKDPRDEVDPPEGGEIADRFWTFEYDVSDRLERIIDPMGFRIDLTYDTDGRVDTMTDKYDWMSGAPIDTYTYTYDAEGHLVTVTDPAPHAEGTALSQGFTLAAWDTNPILGTYTDRRGNDWEYRYQFYGTVGFPDGNLRFIVNPLSFAKVLGFDADRNMIEFDDELYRRWTYSYDDRGNMLTWADPLLHVQTWTYNGDNNVTSYTDALGNPVDYFYEDLSYPTLLTRMEEPGAPIAETTFEYYHVGHGGLLKEVRDPNDVATTFDYDEWGQISFYGEGEQTGPGSAPVFDCTFVYDSGGRQVEGGCSPCGDTTYDANDNPTASGCDGKCDPDGGGGASSGPPATFPRLPCPSSEPTFPKMSARFQGAQYTPKGELIELPLDIWDDLTPTYSRTFTADYDEFGRMIASDVTSDESGDPVVRSFGFVHELAAGTFTRTGPDGVATSVQLDAANRISSFRRGPLGDPIAQATYIYYDNNLVDTIAYDNLTHTKYIYDAAQRVTTIHHTNILGNTILRLDYSYYDNDLVASVTEHDDSTQIAALTFTYDARGRLTREVRDDDLFWRDYDYTYEYDVGGNRTLKVEYKNLFTSFEERYVYDIDDPVTYGSDNNRLMKMERYHIDTSGGSSSSSFGGPTPGGAGGGPLAAGGGGGPTLLSTTYYYYSNEGNVTRVVTNQAGTDQYSATRFVYALNGRAVTFVTGETWDWNGNPSFCPTLYDITYAREFRYDGARQRYLNRELDPDTLDTVYELWSDYDGDEVYGHFDTDGMGTVNEVDSIELGLASISPWQSGGGSVTRYYHTDMLGTTRARSDSSGNGLSGPVYSAFGERIDGFEAYGYDGAWGYQATYIGEASNPSDAFPFLHVGARYYDPAIGRFLQRDPIGIRAGTNVYAYVGSSPTRRIDPLGLDDKKVECQDQCEVWGGPGMGKKTREDCYMSCNSGYWPPPPARQPPPKDFDPWPGPNPPVSPPRPPGPKPKPGGSWDGEAVLALLILLVLAISLGKPLAKDRARAV